MIIMYRQILCAISVTTFFRRIQFNYHRKQSSVCVRVWRFVKLSESGISVKTNCFIVAFCSTLHLVKYEIFFQFFHRELYCFSEDVFDFEICNGFDKCADQSFLSTNCYVDLKTRKRHFFAYWILNERINVNSMIKTYIRLNENVGAWRIITFP